MGYVKHAQARIQDTLPRIYIEVARDYDVWPEFHSFHSGKITKHVQNTVTGYREGETETKV
jgi:hypothetical protein